MSPTAHADYTATHCIPYGVMHDLTNTHDIIFFRKHLFTSRPRAHGITLRANTRFP
jgi:hypothetical protein